jgi:hypothetical protein
VDKWQLDTAMSVASVGDYGEFADDGDCTGLLDYSNSSA